MSAYFFLNNKKRKGAGPPPLPKNASFFDVLPIEIDRKNVFFNWRRERPQPAYEDEYEYLEDYQYEDEENEEVSKKEPTEEKRKPFGTNQPKVNKKKW